MTGGEIARALTVPAQPGGRRGAAVLLRWSNVGVIVLLFVIASLLSEHFLTLRNLMNLLRGTSMTGITALGMTIVILNRGVDLSVGSLVGLSAVLAAGLQVHGVATAWAAAFAVALALGFANGLLIAGLRLQPFVATLAMLIFARGLVYLYSDGSNVLVRSPHPVFVSLGSGYVGLVPVPVLIWAAAYTLLALVMAHTVFGRRVNLVGANPEAAHVLGISVARNRIEVYALSGALAGLAGILLTSRLTVGDPQAGNLYELDAIAAALIGGTTFDGGVGSLHGTVGGTIILAVLSNILNLVGMSPYFQIIAKGVVIVVAVVLSELRYRHGSRTWVHLRR